MKKILTVLVLAFSSNAFPSLAQIPNSGFENLNTDGTLQHWGNLYISSVWFDSLGNSHADSIVYDNQYYAPSSDAHSGTYALELRNAWNFTTNVGIAGEVFLVVDSVFSAFSSQSISTLNQPANFSFYYKFVQVNGDTAAAHLSLWDSTGNMIGEGLALITNPAANYTLITTPIIYTLPGTVAYFSLSFSNFYSSTPGSHQPGFGTRFLIDDISFDNAASINELSDAVQIRIYPNPAASEIQISLNSNSSFETELFNTAGECLLKKQNQNRVDVSEMPAGIYFVKVRQGKNYFSKKLVKQR
jgi:hypothetical protein